MIRAWFAGLVGVMAIGCSNTEAPEPMVDPMDTEPIVEPPPEPAVVLPELIDASAVLEDENPDPDIVEVRLTASHQMIDLGDGMVYEMMTYNGLAPGPALQAKVGDEVIVHFQNDLGQPTTIHWHGLRISDQMDGNPRIQEPVPPGGTFEYRFVVPEAGTFWYHPHVRSNVQVEHGLYGPIVFMDEDDPEYDAERIVVLDDILIDPDSELLPPALGSHPEVMHGRYGNVLLTNGYISEAATAEAEQGHVERWRLVNTANARTMTLSIEGASFRVIGVDGGKLREPYELDRLLMPVGTRFDVEVTYQDAGEVRLVSHVLSSTATGDVEEIGMPVYVVEVAAAERTPRVIEWPVLAPLPVREVERDAELVFDAVNTPSGVQWRINGESHPMEPLFIFREGETVRMTLRNEAGPEHPFHLHGQWFEVVDQGTPWTSQPGLKDTVLVPGFESVEVIAYLDNPGRWMAHCHILEHAQLGMMAEIVVE